MADISEWSRGMRAFLCLLSPSYFSDIGWLFALGRPAISSNTVTGCAQAFLCVTLIPLSLGRPLLVVLFCVGTRLFLCVVPILSSGDLGCKQFKLELATTGCLLEEKRFSLLSHVSARLSLR